MLPHESICLLRNICYVSNEAKLRFFPSLIRKQAKASRKYLQSLERTVCINQKHLKDQHRSTTSLFFNKFQRASDYPIVYDNYVPNC